jgi:hypothetical protein
MPQKIAVMISGMVVAFALSMSAANSPIIGMVSSDPGQAGVWIDGARVSSNATLFDGSEVTTNGYSRLQLNSGARLNLGANSAARVFANHASLESGAGEIQNATGFTIDARALKIQLAEASSIARVRLDGDQRVLVTAVQAPVNVWNSQGLLVARVMPEAPMSFLPQAAAGNAFSSSGCVINKSGTAVLVDQTGNQVFELHPASGVDVRKFVGKRAAVTGTVNSSATPMQGANQVVNVTAIAASTGGDCAPVATRVGGTTTAAGMAGGAAAGGAAAGGGAAAAGVSGAVIGGVVAAAGAAAVVGGLAAAGTFSSSSPN